MKIELDDQLYAQLRDDAGRELRSVDDLAASYIRIGRTISQSPYFSEEDVARALPQYDPDIDEVPDAVYEAIRKRVPQSTEGRVLSSIID
ncbi:TA system antitoxin ParD family protein [Sinimarinibacterium thermocellulolyticum]|uniref:Uncharacterized protein n=1 Tax=Sinimarinibacterium thermocellulolyticum TaxID=3170016 RepID=A0ABV2A977_9GAMM